MAGLAPALTALRQALGATAREGVLPTGIDGVTFFWNEQPVPRAPLLYDAGLVLVGQGGKVGYLGGRRVDYGADVCLVLGVPVPFECAVFASPEAPLLGLRIDVAPETIRALVARLGPGLAAPRRSDAKAHFGVEPVPIAGTLLAAADRLVRSLSDPLDRMVVGAAAVEEIIYRILRSPQGEVLAALTRHHSTYASVAQALEVMHRDYSDALAVADLAQASAMSVSAFHRAFKQVTGETPLQYLKKLRLLKAKARLVFDGMRVDEAAYSVGYASASQFSREFKRYFTVPPSEAQSLPYSTAPQPTA